MNDAYKIDNKRSKLSVADFELTKIEIEGYPDCYVANLDNHYYYVNYRDLFYAIGFYNNNGKLPLLSGNEHFWIELFRKAGAVL